MKKRYLLGSFLSLLLSLWSSSSLQAQVIAPGRGGAHLVGGGFLSDYSPDYGPNRLWGIGGFLYLNLRNHIGVEGEVRFLRFKETYSVHQDNYNIGPRYRWRFRRYEPYGKFMIGNGQMNFPFSYGHGGGLLFDPGSGVKSH